MTEEAKRQGDKDPEPIKNADAERLSGSRDSSGEAEEIEDDPSRNPDDPELRDVKGG
jgi:hypothetical protein